VEPRYPPAAIQRPERAIRSVSSIRDDRVVYPPQIPVARNNLQCGWKWAGPPRREVNTPMRKVPVTFAVKVPQGNEAANGKRANPTP
jgi:hypothetical protein